MSTSGLRVRCLASTRVVQAAQETERDGLVGAESCDGIRTHTAQEIAEGCGLNSDEERDERAASSPSKNEDLLDNERVASSISTSTPSASASASSEGSDSASDSGTSSFGPS